MILAICSIILLFFEFNNDNIDILGDRIAIMFEGRVQCSGSSMFLKNRFGAGYALIIDRESYNNPHDNERNLYEMRQLVQNMVPDAKMTLQSSGEVSFNLPLRVSFNLIMYMI